LGIKKKAVIIMQIYNRLAVVLTALCLSVFIFASCAMKEIKPMGDRKPHTDSPESHPMGKPAKAFEASAKEGDVAAEKKAEISPLAVLKEDKIDQKLLSEIRPFESTSIYFDFDKSALRPDAQSTLKRLAEWLQANPQYSVQIEGHSDEKGPDGYNLTLAETRATAAEKYLQMLGIDEKRISTISYGEERPADPGKNEEAWAKNRRDEFKLIRKP
jgi:peptidoglycan-associated lipoprotein